MRQTSCDMLSLYDGRDSGRERAFPFPYPFSFAPICPHMPPSAPFACFFSPFLLFSLPFLSLFSPALSLPPMFSHFLTFSPLFSPFLSVSPLSSPVSPVSPFSPFLLFFPHLTWHDVMHCVLIGRASRSQLIFGFFFGVRLLKFDDRSSLCAVSLCFAAYAFRAVSR